MSTVLVSMRAWMSQASSSSCCRLCTLVNELTTGNSDGGAAEPSAEYQLTAQAIASLASQMREQIEELKQERDRMKEKTKG